MRAFSMAIVIFAAGCAVQPNPKQPPQPEAAAAITDGVTDLDSPEEAQLKRVAYARKLHLKVVNQDGDELYCRTFMVTGSRIQTETRCLTAKQLDHYDQHNQRDVDNIFKQYTISGPSALPGPSR